MPTPAERKALLFLAVVATLGASVRCWRAKHPPHLIPAGERISAGESRPSKGKTKTKKSKRTNDRYASDEFLDPDLTVDLDVASAEEIDALGLLKPGQARQLVRDREAYGPFGSIEALQRVPFFPKSAIMKLAPRVTFSRLPRPLNAVIQRPRDSTPPRRKRRRPSDVAP